MIKYETKHSQQPRHKQNEWVMFMMRQTILRKFKVVGGIEVALFVVDYELFVCQRTGKELIARF